MVGHDPKTFSTVARLLQEHVKDAQERCSAFEHRCWSPEFLASTKGEDRVASARWWWREVIEFIKSSRRCTVVAYAPTCLLDVLKIQVYF